MVVDESGVYQSVRLEPGEGGGGATLLSSWSMTRCRLLKEDLHTSTRRWPLGMVG